MVVSIDNNHGVLTDHLRHQSQEVETSPSVGYEAVVAEGVGVSFSRTRLCLSIFSACLCGIPPYAGQLYMCVLCF